MDITKFNKKPVVLSRSEAKSLPKFALKGCFECFCYKVIDGDSIKVCLWVGSQPYKFLVRITGVDTPELRSKNLKEKEFARKVRDYLKSWIEGKIVNLTLSKDIDKYGRLLATVSFEGADIVEDLISKGYGYSYDGGTKRKWFDAN